MPTTPHKSVLGSQWWSNRRLFSRNRTRRWRDRNRLGPHERVGLLSGALLVGLLIVPTNTVAAAPLIDCVSSDNGDPQVTAVTVSPTTVDVTQRPQTVTVTATARDTGGPGPASGLRRVEVSLVHGDDENEYVALKPVMRGQWVGALTIPRWTPDGVWRLSQAYVQDRVGQEMLYGGEDPMPFHAALRIVSTGDRTSPRLTGLSFTPKAVNTSHRPRYVRFTARARDDQTGVAGVTVVLMSPATGRVAYAALTKKPGSSMTYRGRVVIPRWIRSSRWRMWFVVVFDRAGNDKVYSSGALAKLGFQRHLRVVSRPDRTRPTITGFRRGPGALDVRRASGKVTVTVHARDTGPGVRRVDASFSGIGDPSVDVSLHRVSGTARNGVWLGTATIRPCPALSQTLTASAEVTDRRGRSRFYSTRQVKQHDWPATLRIHARHDAVPPRVRQAGPQSVPLAGPVAMRFNEDVNGLTNNSVTVRPVDPESAAPPQPVLAGRLTCTTRSGRVTSCTTGHVREATFEPSVPLRPNRYYFVELNPEHSLEVTDLAGNPFDRDGFLVTTRR